MSRRRTFFERITGSVNIDTRDRFARPTHHEEEDDYYDDNDVDQVNSRFSNRYDQSPLESEMDYVQKTQITDGYTQNKSSFNNEWLPKDNHGSELSIDLYELDDEIILQAMISGVRAEDLDINVNREMVTIEGHREGPQGIPDQNYFHQELFWGAFNRTIMLPAEIEVEDAEASESHGLLTIRLPKLDKARSTKLKVKTRS